jgi:ABC-2 type transport system ATP-binding protein
MSNIIEARDLVKRYGDYTALDNLSLAIPKGSIFGLLGPNGAGKTSLIRIITQITAPDQGQLLFQGEPLKPSHIGKIGYLPEERGLYKKAKVGEQLLYLAQLKGLSKAEATERAKEWFIRLDIKEWWNKNLEELSKGMAQKVQFVATVLHQPEFIILDEPFSGFDPVNSDVIRDEILRLHDLGSTILFSTHRMDTVEELCSHIVLIDKARKVIEGSTREVRDRFRTHRYKVVTAGPIVFEGFPWEAEVQNQASDEGFVSHFSLLPEQVPNELVADVLRAGTLIRFEEIIPSFHDIFVQAVTGPNSW